MLKDEPSYSFSALKILGTSNSPKFPCYQSKASHKISPGGSPSSFAIQNFPIEHSQCKKSSNFFFNSSISLNELRKLADIPTIEEGDENEEILFKHNHQFLSGSLLKNNDFLLTFKKKKKKMKKINHKKKI